MQAPLVANPWYGTASPEPLLLATCGLLVAATIPANALIAGASHAKPEVAMAAAVTRAHGFQRHAAADDGGAAVARDRLRARGLHRLGIRRRRPDRRLQRGLHPAGLAELHHGRRDRLHHLHLDLHALSVAES